MSEMKQNERFVVKESIGQPAGTKRWIIFDTLKHEWADEPRYTRDDAQSVCDELNALGSAGDGCAV